VTQADFSTIAQRAFAKSWLHGEALIDTTLTACWASESLCALINQPMSEIIGRSVFDLLHPDDHAICLAILEYEAKLNPTHRTVLQQRNVRDIRVLGSTGQYRTLEVELTNHFDDPDIGMLLIRASAPTQFRHLHYLFENSADQTEVSVVLNALLTEFTSGDVWQPAAVIISPDGAILASTPNAAYPAGSSPTDYFRTHWERPLVSTSGISLGKVIFSCPLEAPHPFDLDASIRVANIASALIERQGFAEELAAAALLDPLTGIANRRSLEQDLRRRSESDDDTLVVYIDVDRFKQVNDQYGHAVGDKVLVTVAERLKQSLRKGDLVARVGGDEFVLLLNNQSQSLDAFGTRLIALIRAPMSIEGHLLEISASVGFGSGNLDPADLLRNADEHMLANKRQHVSVGG
jgi:diguanylate cyclase (GGDEF)-like protein